MTFVKCTNIIAAPNQVGPTFARQFPVTAAMSSLKRLTIDGVDLKDKRVFIR